MNKVVRNYLYNLSYQILVLLVPLITTPYVSRVLGAKGVGTFSYTNSVVQYFILFGCIGLNLYGQREIAYVQHDKGKYSSVFWELVILRLCTVSLSLVLFVVTLASRGKYALVFSIMSLDILASMADISWFFQGIEDFRKIVVRNFIVKIVGVALIFTFVRSSADIYLYVICHSATLFLGNLSMWVYVPKLVGRTAPHNLHPFRHIKPTIVLFLPQIATSIYTILDKTMIGFLTGIEEEVAYYEQSQKIVKIAMALVTSLGTVMLPRVANLFKKNKMDQVKAYLYKSFHFVLFFATPMTLGLMAVSYNIVPWFFGPGYDKVAANMVIIAPILLIIAISNIIGTQFLLPTGRQKEYTMSVIVGCCVNCILNSLFIPHFLSIGAAIATVFAEGCVTLTQIICTRQDFDYREIVSNNLKCIVSSVIMFVPTTYVATKLTPTILHTLLCILIGGAIYVVSLVIMKEPTLQELLGKYKN